MTTIANLSTVPAEAWRHGAFGGAVARISDAAGGTQLGVVVESLPAGLQSSPRHFHMKEEEHLLVLEGEPTLLLGEERTRLKPGDYVVFRAARPVAHALINETPDECRYLVMGLRFADDVVVYPDSNKVKINLLGETLLAAGVDYWQGED
jgi:uncharacterized cupin superfamily protein